MRRAQTLILGATILIAGCRTPGAESTSQPSEPACRVQLSVERESRGGQWFLHAIVTNQTAEPLVLTLHDRCPGGSVDFSGLGEGVDYYGTCTMGACGPRPDVELELAPGAPTRLATAVVNPRGGGCNAPLAPGRYSVSFGLPLVTPISGLCVTPLEVEYAAPSASDAPTE